MSLSKYESDVKHMDVTPAEAYAHFDDLRKLETLKEQVANLDLNAQLPDKVTPEQAEQVKKSIENISFEQDAISMVSPVGNITLRIVERTDKCVKFESEGSPLPLFVWVQIIPEGDAASKMRVTVGAEVSFFMKGLVAKPLKQAADGLAAILVAAITKHA